MPSTAASSRVRLASAAQIDVQRGSEAVTLPLDHAFGFELADVRPAAIEVSASADALPVAGFLDGGRETAALATDGRSNATVSVIVPVASRQDTPIAASA